MSYACYDQVDLIRVVEKRIGSDSITALVSLLGRLGTLDLLVQALGLEDSDEDNGRVRKVLVIGASDAPVESLRRLTLKAGYDRDWFEYSLDYKKLTARSIGRLRNSSYSAVIVGPMPHSTKGKGEASSAIQRMKDHPESYPPVIEARDSNSLKITNNSFKQALKELEGLLAA